jgi:hypothetical protein
MTSTIRRERNRIAMAFAVVTFVAAAVGAQVMPGAGGTPMPDARRMSGVPLPVGDLPVGTVVVRVARGAVTNPLAGQTVTLTVAGTPRSMSTNDSGRAEFSGLAVGAQVKATATVGTETLQSQEFAVPAAGGIRVALVATDPELEKKAAEDRKLAQGPAQPGIVVLDDQSRFVVEMGDESLSVYNIVQILNTAKTPVRPPQPVVFELPAGAAGAGILEGSSPQAKLAGSAVTVEGPFAPGQTLVQFAYSMPYSGPDLSFDLKVPVALMRVTVLAQKVGQLQLTSPQFNGQRDMNANGQTFILAQGPALKAGDAVTFNFAGLPHSPTWPRTLALVAAVAILGAGAWGSLRPRRASVEDQNRHSKLSARRDRLFADLAELEEQHRTGAIDPARFAVRRRELVTALERVYAELDEEAA